MCWIKDLFYSSVSQQILEKDEVTTGASLLMGT